MNEKLTLIARKAYQLQFNSSMHRPLCAYDVLELLLEVIDVLTDDE
jgi:hypothetical protein